MREEAKSPDKVEAMKDKGETTKPLEEEMI
jgi:hypothetical protein